MSESLGWRSSGTILSAAAGPWNYKKSCWGRRSIAPKPCSTPKSHNKDQPHWSSNDLFPPCKALIIFIFATIYNRISKWYFLLLHALGRPLGLLACCIEGLSFLPLEALFYVGDVFLLAAVLIGCGRDVALGEDFGGGFEGTLEWVEVHEALGKGRILALLV